MQNTSHTTNQNFETSIQDNLRIKIPHTQNQKPVKKPGFLSKVFGFVQFITISTCIYAIIHIGLNWAAYEQKAKLYFDPQALEPTTKALEQAEYEPEKEQELLKIAKKQKEVKKEFPPLDLQVTPPDNRIIIPKLGKNVPISSLDAQALASNSLIGREFEGVMQEALQDGVVHYPGTAFPGQNGNFFLTGHSSYYPWDEGRYKTVFALLEKLEIGDVYYVYFNQKKYTYEVFDKFEVQPTELSVLDQPQDQKIATLMTCTPVGTDLRRLIVKARQV